LPARRRSGRQNRTKIVCSPTQVDVRGTGFPLLGRQFDSGEPAMRAKPQRLRNAVGHETTRVLAYALSGVANEFARLLRRHQTGRRSALTRRGESGMSKRCVFQLLCRALHNAMLNPRGDLARAAKQRSALAYVLAAANVPSPLCASGIPAELLRARKRRRR
jgi:hypothetical protein